MADNLASANAQGYKSVSATTTNHTTHNSTKDGEALALIAEMEKVSEAIQLNKIVGVIVDETGKVIATYTDGTEKAIYQLPIGVIADPNKPAVGSIFSVDDTEDFMDADTNITTDYSD